MGEAVVHALGRLPTAIISDAMDRCGIVGACPGLSPLGAGAGLVGRAFTVRYRPLERSTIASPPGYLDAVQAGDVIVVDNGGRVDCAVWDGLLTQSAKARGVAGAVVYGAARAVEVARRLGYPVFARGTHVSASTGRVELDEIGGMVSVEGVQILPGDLIRADADGVVVVPSSRADDVLRLAQELAAIEGEAVQRSVRGLPQADVWAIDAPVRTP